MVTPWYPQDVLSDSTLGRPAGPAHPRSLGSYPPPRAVPAAPCWRRSCSGHGLVGGICAVSCSGLRGFAIPPPTRGRCACGSWDEIRQGDRVRFLRLAADRSAEHRSAPRRWRTSRAFPSFPADQAEVPDRDQPVDDADRPSGCAATEATAGDLSLSLLWRDLLSGYGVMDVASLVFRDSFGCWGFLDLWRRRLGPVQPGRGELAS